ncbi:hypothetical protein DH2020_040114 [Rehmannia glutinosa]|uniref:Tf2-1-like SH3-like domain-containing protein n=1 Tax=Rehmannia glutinosa TaxID=99300 RepID=A0ABR0UV17_REHGL
MKEDVMSWVKSCDVCARNKPGSGPYQVYCNPYQSHQAWTRISMDFIEGCMIHTTPKKWLQWLPLAEFWYNTNYHTSMKLTPFQALYGYAPPLHSMGAYLDSTNEEVRGNLLQAQNRMKVYADRHRQEREFEVGEFVYLKLQPFRQNSVEFRKNLKFASKYYGPYLILEKVGKVAYKLELPEGSRIHPVFHVSLLKKCLGQKHLPSSELPSTDKEGNFKIVPLQVIDQREITRKGEKIQQLRVKWLDLREGFESWEDLKFLQKKFPQIDPWGQGSTARGGIVVSSGDKVEKD